MAKCQSCLKGINSTYIREGVRGSFRKIGYYCNTCNIHYNTDKKLYTVNEELYTVFSDSQDIIPTGKIQDNENITTIHSKINKKSNFSHQKHKKQQPNNSPAQIRTGVKGSKGLYACPLHSVFNLIRYYRAFRAVYYKIYLHYNFTHQMKRWRWRCWWFLYRTPVYQQGPPSRLASSWPFSAAMHTVLHHSKTNLQGTQGETQ